MAIDDATRLAYVEIHPDERGATCAGFLQRAGAWFAEHGVTIERVMTDNAFAYRRSHAFQAALADLAARHTRTRPYRPQTNGKAERFNKTLTCEWAYARVYDSNAARAASLHDWLHDYNHHRPHTALNGRSPMDELEKHLPEQHTYSLSAARTAATRASVQVTVGSSSKTVAATLAAPSAARLHSAGPVPNGSAVTRWRAASGVTAAIRVSPRSVALASVATTAGEIPSSGRMR